MEPSNRQNPQDEPQNRKIPADEPASASVHLGFSCDPCGRPSGRRASAGGRSPPRSRCGGWELQSPHPPATPGPPAPSPHNRIPLPLQNTGLHASATPQILELPSYGPPPGGLPRGWGDGGCEPPGPLLAASLSRGKNGQVWVRAPWSPCATWSARRLRSSNRLKVRGQIELGQRRGPFFLAEKGCVGRG